MITGKRTEARTVKRTETGTETGMDDKRTETETGTDGTVMRSRSSGRLRIAWSLAAGPVSVHSPAGCPTPERARALLYVG
jgi:hypothetical protein